MLFLLGNLGKRSERKRALDFAHVILENIALGEGLREMETIFYF